MGADIEAPKEVVCDDLGNNLHYTLAEVDGNGAVVRRVVEGDTMARYQRLNMSDLGSNGVEVNRGVNDNPMVKPGDSLSVQVGEYAVKIMGTKNRGVLLNGTRATKIKGELEQVRYPKTGAGILHI